MNLAVKIAYNSLAQLGGRFFGTLLGLFAVAIMTRYLGSALFGQYTTIVTYASVFAIAADLGLTLVASQMINRVGVDEKRTLANLFAFRSVTALVMIGLAPLTVWWLPYETIVKVGVVVATGSFWFISLNQVFVSVFQKHLKTERIALAEVLSRLLLVGLTAYVAMADLGLIGMVAAMTISNALYFALHWGMSRSLIKFAWRFDWPVWKEIWHLSWPLLLTIVSNLIYLKADILLLSFLRSPVEVGLYGAAYKVVDILVSLPFMFAGLMLPLLVKYWSGKLKDKFGSTVQMMLDATGVFAWPILVGGFVLAVPIMVAVTGADFADSGLILRILLIAIVAVYFSCALTHAIIGLAKQRTLIVYYLITALVSLPVYLFLIKNYGVYGAAWGTVFSEVLICSFAWWRLQKELGRVFKNIINLKALVAAMMMGALLWPLRSWADTLCGLIVLVVGAAAVYCLIVWRFGLLKNFDLANLKYEQKNISN